MNENELIKYFFPTTEITYLAAWPLWTLIGIMILTVTPTANENAILFCGLITVSALMNYYHTLAIYHALTQKEKTEPTHGIERIGFND